MNKTKEATPKQTDLCIRKVANGYIVHDTASRWANPLSEYQPLCATPPFVFETFASLTKHLRKSFE